MNQAIFINVTYKLTFSTSLHLLSKLFTRSTEDTTEPTFNQFYVTIALLIQLEFILTPFLHSNFLQEKSMDFYRSSSLRPLNESFFATKSLDRLSPTIIGCWKLSRQEENHEIDEKKPKMKTTYLINKHKPRLSWREGP